MNVDMLISLVIYFSVFKCHTVYNCYTEPVVWISYILAKKKKIIHKEIVAKKKCICDYVWQYRIQNIFKEGIEKYHSRIPSHSQNHRLLSLNKEVSAFSIS